jgi:hypothetical protein
MSHYPTRQACSIPGSGSAFYLYLLKNIAVPSRLPHDLWFKGQTKLLEDREHPFQGYYPIGKTYKIAYGTKPMGDYTFTGDEKNAVYVRDLSPEAILQLGIQKDAEPVEKVWNPNYVTFDNLPEKVRISNETATMSLAKSISSYLGAKDILYTEKDVITMLVAAIKNASSQEMRTILHGNHVAWCATRYLDTGIMEEDIKREFYGQNNMEFYIRDIGTIMPAILFSFAILGKSPVEMIGFLDYDLWGIEEVAKELENHMKVNQELRAAA